MKTIIVVGLGILASSVVYAGSLSNPPRPLNPRRYIPPPELTEEEECQGGSGRRERDYDEERDRANQRAFQERINTERRLAELERARHDAEHRKSIEAVTKRPMLRR